jgi:hypothetical protein
LDVLSLFCKIKEMIKIPPFVGILIILASLSPTLFLIWSQWSQLQKEVQLSQEVPQVLTIPLYLSASEKKAIDQWIVENQLNQYGDPADTVYAGGTPLFDETTGKTIDRYEYILKNHPDRPWRK